MCHDGQPEASDRARKENYGMGMDTDNRRCGNGYYHIRLVDKMKKLNTMKPTIHRLDTRQGSSVATERIRGRALRAIRDRIGLRDEYTCRMCGHVTAHGEVDHITPLYAGGRESDENRWYL